MPVTPTITITQPTDAPPRLRVTINNGASTGAINRIWRSTSTENLGTALKIAAGVAYNGRFDDFNVASGLSYNYYVIADDGTTATSSTQAGSITLGTAFIHPVTKSSPTANAVASTSGWQYVQLEAGDYVELEGGGYLELEGSDSGYGPAGLAFYDQSHARSYRTDSVLRLLNNSGGPHIGVSTIEEATIGVPAIIPKRNDDIRGVLRTAYMSRAMLCLRTALGNKWFGRLSSFREQPSGINWVFNLSFEVLDFTESVA